MAPKSKKEGPVPPKPQVKAKALKARKAALKCILSHKQEILMSPTFCCPKTLCLWRQLRYSEKSTPGETSLTTMPLSNSFDH